MATNIANVPSRPADDVERLKARSASFMPAAGWEFSFYDFNTSVVATPWSVAGSWTADATRGAGVWSAASLAAQVLFKTSATVANPAVTPWHVAGRLLCSVAITAGDIKGMALSPFGDGVVNTCHVGIVQSISATKYVFRAVKASATVSALSTVTYDNLFHIFEIWFDGVNMWGSVDGESPVLVTTAANLPIVPCMERHGIEAAAGGANQTFFDYFYVAAGKTIS